MNHSEKEIKNSLEARASALRNRISQSQIAKPEQLLGCSDKEIEALEKACGLALPYSYKVFLKNFGRCFGGVANEVEFLYQDVFPLTTIAKEILQDEGDPILPESAFVFTMRYGEQFFFFEAEEGIENPPIFYYMEGDKSFSQKYDSIFDLWEGEVKLKEEILARRQER